MKILINWTVRSGTTFLYQLLCLVNNNVLYEPLIPIPYFSKYLNFSFHYYFTNVEKKNLYKTKELLFNNNVSLYVDFQKILRGEGVEKFFFFNYFYDYFKLKYIIENYFNWFCFKEVTLHLYLGDDIFEGRYKFHIIRNPIDVFISFYKSLFKWFLFNEYNHYVKEVCYKLFVYFGLNRWSLIRWSFSLIEGFFLIWILTNYYVMKLKDIVNIIYYHDITTYKKFINLLWIKKDYFEKKYLPITYKWSRIYKYLKRKFKEIIEKYKFESFVKELEDIVWYI